MFVRYRTEGLIFKKRNQEEADQLFTIYTKDFGKLKILGKAIRKTKAKLRGNVQLFFLSEIEFIQGKTYKILTDALLIKNFPEIKKDLKKLKVAHRIADLLDLLVKGQEPEEEIWNLLEEVFNKLNNLQFTIFSLQLIYYYFLWNLLTALGYRPQLYNCSLCQEKLTPEKLYFSPKAGGVICSNCAQPKKEKLVSVHPDTVKILRLILDKNYPVLEKLKIDKSNLKKIKEVSQRFLSFIITQTR